MQARKMKFRRKIFKILLYSIIIGLSTYFLGTFWLKNYSWKMISTEKEMIENGIQIKNSPDLSDNFYNVYDKIKPFQRNINMNQQLWGEIIIPHNGKDCKCDDIGYLSLLNDNLKLEFKLDRLTKGKKYLNFGFGLEKYSNSKKCFDYWINNSILFNGVYLNNLNELSEKIFNQEIKQLENEEIIMLIAWHDMLKKGQKDIEIINKRFEILKRVYERNKAST